jgi:hypothetical protein
MILEAILMPSKMLPMVVVLTCICGVGAQSQVTTDGGRLTFADSGTAQTADPVVQAPEVKTPVILTFDRFPGPLWVHNTCAEGANTFVFHGILTLESAPPTCNEFVLLGPTGVWNKYVDYKRGWIIEASLQIDPSTPQNCGENFGRSSVQIWAADHRTLTLFGFSTGEICIAYPEQVIYPMDTSGFHVYRMEKKANRARIYVDGVLVIDHTFSIELNGTQALAFGDGDRGEPSYSLSKWDYLSYDVFSTLNW